MYEARKSCGAIVHLHSTHSVAVSCLADIDPDDVLPPITAYFVMRVGKLKLLPYFPPGDPAPGCGDRRRGGEAQRRAAGQSWTRRRRHARSRRR